MKYFKTLQKNQQSLKKFVMYGTCLLAFCHKIWYIYTMF